MQSPEGGSEFSPFGNVLPVADRQRGIEGDFQKHGSTDIVRLIAVVNTYKSLLNYDILGCGLRVEITYPR
jgi:hypothetical protein